MLCLDDGWILARWRKRIAACDVRDSRHCRLLATVMAERGYGERGSCTL